MFKNLTKVSKKSDDLKHDEYDDSDEKKLSTIKLESDSKNTSISSSTESQQPCHQASVLSCQHRTLLAIDSPESQQPPCSRSALARVDAKQSEHPLCLASTSALKSAAVDSLNSNLDTRLNIKEKSPKSNADTSELFKDLEREDSAASHMTTYSASEDPNQILTIQEFLLKRHIYLYKLLASASRIKALMDEANHQRKHLNTIERKIPQECTECPKHWNLLITYWDSASQNLERWLNETCDIINRCTEKLPTPKDEVKDYIITLNHLYHDLFYLETFNKTAISQHAFVPLSFDIAVILEFIDKMRVSLVSLLQNLSLERKKFVAFGEVLKELETGQMETLL